MIAALYITWQDPEIRAWHTVGKLERERDAYRFQYTGGALQSPQFMPFGPMRDLHKTYYSYELFPLFANRIMNKRRPEYRDYLRWLNVAEDDDPLLLLARSGGARATDLLEVFPRPERDKDGYYTLYFFSHGLRHLPAESRQCANALSAGAELDL
ncbi:MAG: hypothetical protein GY862_05235, partial [Gammaproteobacteria bacterium]|nr:hypothetical protein [Gammaproteobacteria bacterium]